MIVNDDETVYLLIPRDVLIERTLQAFKRSGGMYLDAELNLTLPETNKQYSPQQRAKARFGEQLLSDFGQEQLTGAQVQEMRALENARKTPYEARRNKTKSSKKTA